MELIAKQYDHEMEAAVLGAVMLENEAMLTIATDYGVHLFHDESHKVVAKAILHLHQEKKQIDILTVTHRVKEMGLIQTVTPYFISQLTNRVASSANIVYHTRILQQFFMHRACCDLGHQLIKMSQQRDKDPFDTISEALSVLDKIQAGVITKQFDTINSMASPFLEELEARRQKVVPVGLPYGLKSLDSSIGGTNKTDFIVVGARPGMGKTAFIIKKVRTVAIVHKKPVGIFSLEMASMQLLYRIASAETQISYDKFRSGHLTNGEMNVLSRKVNELKNAEIYIDDTGGLDIMDLVNRARRMKMLYNIEELYIDYLQLLKARLKNKGGNREQEISEISRSLKALAKELNIPIIALSQLSREVEKRSDKRPQLSDLRESGSLEQDADQVLFIYRPEYYGINEIELEGNQTVNSSKRALIDTAKNRHGKTGLDMVGFAGEFTEFYDLQTF